MGLSLDVGILAYLKHADEEGYAWYVDEFQSLNNVLRSEGLAEHVEPDELDERFSCDMLNYAGLHYLRRIAVHLALAQPTPAPGDQETWRIAVHLALGQPTPVPGDEKTIRNFALTDKYFNGFNAGKDMKYQHLIVHSDAEGFYVPIDFERVLATPGGWLGSTQRLQAECAELAGVLKMPLDMDYESDELWEAVEAQVHSGSQSPRRLWPWKRAETEHSGDLMWKRYAVETYTCLGLLEACKVSLRTKAAIVFC